MDKESKIIAERPREGHHLQRDGPITVSGESWILLGAGSATPEP
ncbi:MAG: hypothetical protein OJF52_001529 [Nitrospira sp.]|nr:MAG: hypothetical protein OJF52_001529 [Nitrospira sp.]